MLSRIFRQSVGLVALLAAPLTVACGSDNDKTVADTPNTQIELGDEVHVDVDGDPKTADGSEKHPFASLKDAVTAMDDNEDWTGTVFVHKGTHKLDKTVILPLGVKLTIDAGTTFAMGSDVALHTQGDVTAIGTEDEPITFTRASEGVKWSGVTNFEKTSQNNVFEYVIFEYGNETQFKGISERGALSLYESTARISHCTFRNNFGDDGLTLKLSDSLVEYSDFVYNASDAIDDGPDFAEISHCYFEGNGNDAADLGDGSSATVHDCVMFKNGDKGVSFGETCVNPQVYNNLIVGNGIGIGIKDGSTPVLWNNTLYANDVGLAVYEAVAGLGIGKGTLTSSIIWGSVTSDLSLSEGAETVISHSCVQNPTNAATTVAVTGTGLISPGAGCDDPQFVNPDLTDPKTMDFHLKSTAGHFDTASQTWVLDATSSPCIDQGDPAATALAAAEPAPNGAVVNQGTYGGTAQASKSAP